jgi:hypothetical protein
MPARRSIAIYSFIFFCGRAGSGGRDGGRASLRTLCPTRNAKGSPLDCRSMASENVA